MMRVVLLSLFMFLPFRASAAESLFFDGAPITEIARVVYGELFRMPYVFSSGALAHEAWASLDLRELPKNKIVESVDRLMRSSGLTVNKSGGVVWIEKSRLDQMDDGKEPMIYKPKHRPIPQIVALLSPLFPAVRFSGGLPVAGGVGASTGVPAPPASAPASAGSNNGGILDGALPPPPKATQPDAKANFGATPRASGSGVVVPDLMAIYGSIADLEKVAKLLPQVDVPTPEILVKAVVFEVSNDSTEKNAVSLAASVLNVKMNLPGAAVEGLSAVFKSSDFSAVVSALSTDSRFKVISSPSARVRSGSSAALTVGSDVPVLGQATMDKNGNPVQSVEYKSSGVILNVSPVAYDEVVQLQLDQQISNFVPTTSGVNNSPTLIKRQIKTNLGLKSDDVVVMGGLESDKDQSDSSGLSFLPDWLKSKGKTKSQSQILLMVQAQRVGG